MTKSKLIKIVVGLAVAAAGSAGADAAGYMPDPAQLERLGVLGSLLLIGYFEYRVLPAVLPGLQRIAKSAPATASESGEVAEEPVVEVPKKRAATMPGLVVMKPE